MSDRWSRIEVLFGRALELPPESRERFLEETSADPEVRAEVRALLESGGEGEAFLFDLASRLGIPFVGADRGGGGPGDDPEIGRTVGPYRLVRVLGRGGMGAVFEGERDDEHLRKRVALKLLPIGLATDEARHRFLAERRILAGLDHPGISRLLDGGVTDDGTPYFVMELIEGDPIDVYCDRERLEIDERLRLFRRVCAAVHYAHRNLVVHRDLKPGNVLVTAEGTVKLLDFGIAKILDEERTGRATTLTRLGGRPMTPGYASPEQVRGEPVTTASDVYALGVMLYELLSGHAPYRLGGASPAEVERTICEHPLEPPSRAVGRTDSVRGPGGEERTLTPAAVATRRSTRPERLRRRLEGDLDAVVMTALRKEPHRRYGSVAQLDQELGRVLEGLPVEARTDSFGYLASHFVARHRVGVGAGMAIVVLLLALVVVLGRHAAETQAQARAIAEERDRAEQVSVYLASLLTSLGPGEASRDLRAATSILETSARQTESLSDPELRAHLSHVIGDLYTGIGMTEEAGPLLRTALELRLRSHGPGHIAVGRTHNALGRWHWARGAYGVAQGHYLKALHVLEDSLGRGSTEVAHVLNNLGVLLQDRGDPAAAERVYRRALAVFEQELGIDDPATIRTTNNLAASLRDQGRYGEAEPLLRRAVMDAVRLFGADHPRVAVHLHNLGFLYMRTGELEAARTLHQRALEVRRVWFGPDHRVVGNSLHNLAATLRHMEAYDQAEAVFREALRIRRGALRSDHPQVALSLLGLGTTLLYAGRAEEALEPLREGIRIRKSFLPPEHWQVADPEVTLAGALTALRRMDEAETLLLPAYRTLRLSLGPDDVRTRIAERRIEELYAAWGRPETAQRLIRPVSDAPGSPPASGADPRTVAPGRPGGSPRG